MLSRLPIPSRVRRAGQALARMLMLALAVSALGACSLFGDKDPPIANDPADRLYNEGL